MRASVSSSSSLNGHEIIDAAFYTHVTTRTTTTGCKPNWRLIPITLSPVKHKRSSEIGEPSDATRLARRREEFTNYWQTEKPKIPVSEDYSSIKPNQEESLLREENTRRISEKLETPVVLGESLNEMNTTIFELDSSIEIRDGAVNSSDESSIVDTRSHVIADTVKCENSPFLHNGQPDAVATLGNETPEVSAIRTNEGPENSAPLREAIKSATPELLDEIVGNESPFLVKIPRSAITLNLQSYVPLSSKKNNSQARPSPEIRIADSSVSDIENTRDLGVKCNYRGNIEDERSVKKPKIVEDVTCLEGTIIPSLSLSKVPKILENLPKITKTHNEHQEKRKRSKENYKLSDERTLRTTKKSRLRRKFRQLFGNELTLSEVEEEDSMIDRFVRKKRRKCNSRISQDSGVFLGELACSEEFSIEKRSNCPIASNTLEISFENCASVQNFSFNEEKCEVDSDPNLRSMPSLDLPFKSVCHENLSENLPDSTNTEEKSSKLEVTTADSSNDEKIGSKGKLTILISPVDAELPNAFTPLSLEIDLAGESQISTPTSTTRYLSISQPEKIMSTDDTLKTFDIDVRNDTCNITLQGQTLNVQDNVEMNIFMTESPPSTPEPGENLIIDESTEICDESSNFEDPKEKNDNIDEEKVPFSVIDERRQEQEVPMDLCSRTREIERVEESTRIETKDDDNFGITSSVESTGSITNALNITGNIENGIENPGYVARNVEITQNIANNEHCPAPPPVPKFRVLHHHELGSRWCPTPLNDSPVLVDALNFQSPISPIPPIGPILPSQNPQGPSVPIQQPSSLKYLHQMSTNTIFTNLSNLRTLPQQTLVNSPSSASNSPGISLTVNDLNKEPEKSMLNIIFNYLIPLHSYIEQNKLSCNSYNWSQLRNQFAAKKKRLWIEWGKFCSLINTSNIDRVVCTIVRFYEFLFLPGNRILNITRVMEILYMKELPSQQINLDRGTNVLYAPISPSSQYPAPPPYPGTFYVSHNSSLSYVTQNGMTQQPFRANPEQPRTERFHTSRILTDDQLRTFYNQVAIYNKLAKSISQQLNENTVKEKRKRRPRKKAAPLENDTKKTGGKGQDRSVDNIDEMIPRALLEPQQSSETVNQQRTILSGHTATQKSFGAINQGQMIFRMQPETRTSPEIINHQEPISMAQRETQKILDTINREQMIFRMQPETRTSPETINQQRTILMSQQLTQKSLNTINREQPILRMQPETRTSPETINQQETISMIQRETQKSFDTMNREQTIFRRHPETRTSPEIINHQEPISMAQRETQKILDMINREQTIFREQPETRTSPETINQQRTILMSQQLTQKSLNTINREQPILRMQPETRTSPETINQQETISMIQRETQKSFDTMNREQTIFRRHSETRTSPEITNHQEPILMAQQEMEKSLDTIHREQTNFRMQPETRTSPETINQQRTILMSQQETQKSLNTINREQTIFRMQPETRTSPETINQQETIFRMQPQGRTSLETINQQGTILMVQQETQKSLDAVIREPTILRIQPETRGSPETINRPEMNRTTENCNETGNGLTVSLNYSAVGITNVLQELDALSTKNANDDTKKIELPSNSECDESSMIPGGSSGCSETRKIITTDMHEVSCVDETEEIQKTDDSVICSNDDDNLVEKVIDGDEKNCNNNENSNNNDEQVDDGSSEMRQFDVITLDDCESNESVRTQDAASIEGEQIFSILEVKSISKDVFNSMNDHDDVVNEVCENTVEEEQEEEIVTPLSEWSDCFRCGEPSSVVCERCYLAFYCSAECHEAHWTENHHLHCQPVPVETLAELESCDRSS